MYWKLCVLMTCLRLSYCEIIAPPVKGNLDWWQSAIIYEIYPLSFKDTNSDGSGDFKGITQKLDYLVDLGVNAIWITPFFKSPFRSAGYDISDYFDVNDVFGTIADLKELINTAHKKNLRVIMDFVPNHTSDEHDWFKNSVQNNGAYADYYIWKNATNQEDVLKDVTVKPIVPNNWKRIYGAGDEDNSAWIWHSTRKQFYFTQFIPNLPDLNFRNQKVHDEMKKVLDYWIELGIDGIRIDALKHVYESETMKDETIIDPTKPVDYSNLNHDYTVDQDEVYDLIREWHMLLDQFKKKDGNTRIIVTESYSPQSVLFKYYTSGAEIPSNFFLMPLNTRYTPKDFNREIKSWITEMPQGATYNAVLQNHDNKRLPTTYGTELIDGMNALSLFLPGVAIVYYGGEIGMEDISDQTVMSRGPMQWDNTTYAGFTDNISKGPWISVNPDYVERNVQTEKEDPKSYLNFYKALLRLRRTETLKRGGLTTYIFNDTVFVLNRFLPGNENYTLVINMDSNYTQHVRLSDQIPNLNGTLTVVHGSKNSNYSSGNSISSKSMELSPGATIIFTDQTLINTGSSSTRLYVTFKILLLSLMLLQNYYNL